MGCTSSKKSLTGDRDKIKKQGTLSSDEDKWRVEPQRALDQYVKDSGTFGREGSDFDYWQEDTFVELRALLDEPLGRSHFLAHCEHLHSNMVPLVRLWLLLHQYYLISTNDEERYQAAKSIYKHYLHVSPCVKEEALAYLEECQKANNCDEDECKTSEEYNRRCVPQVCRKFPDNVIKVIIDLRPTVESALVAAHDKYRKTPFIKDRAESIGSLCDIPMTALENAVENFEVDTAELTAAEDGKLAASDGDMAAVEMKVNENVNKEEEEIRIIKDDMRESKDDRAVPPLGLFLVLKHEVFKTMRPLFDDFKQSEDYQVYRSVKKKEYNHVEHGDFKYINTLGAGGFGHVVHVIKKSTNRHYAMKVQAKDTLLSTWGGKMQHVELERDVLVAHRSFPFIVSLRYAFQSETYAFLCLDLAEQGSIRNLLDSTATYQLEVPQVRLYVAEIVLALECLHEHEIIYRDLKPENVLLFNDGHVMLADMGLAGFYYQDKYNDEDDMMASFERVDAEEINVELEGDDDLDEDEDEGNTSRTNNKSEQGPPKPLARKMQSHDTDCGTPLYRPPEMVQKKKYGPAVDFFMLGVFTYECLVGRLPFEPGQILGKNGEPNEYAEITTDADELRILHKKCVIPKHLRKETQDLLKGLLDKDQHSRLGAGLAEEGRDIEALKSHPFFVPLGGPLAKELDWGKVLRKEYKPLVISPPKDLETKAHFSNFSALVHTWKKEAKMEAKKEAKRKNEKPNYDNQFIQEGKKVDPEMEKYFDNWDYIDSESILLEKEACRTTLPSKTTSKRKSIAKNLGIVK